MPLLAALLVGDLIGVLAGDLVVMRSVERVVAIGGDILVFFVRVGAITTYSGVNLLVKQSELRFGGYDEVDEGGI